MLTNWTTNPTRGNPIFVHDDYILTIICQEGDRGVWTSTAPVTPGEPLIFTGEWNNGKVRLIFYDENEDEVFSQIVDSGTTPLELVVPEDAVLIRVNCVQTGSGTAVFQHIDLMPPEPEPEIDPFLPVPPPDTTQKHHVTGWKWGRNIALHVHEDDLPDEPPDYIDENEDIIPYEVRGWQHGRRLDLEIGNMRFTDEEE